MFILSCVIGCEVKIFVLQITFAEMDSDVFPSGALIWRVQVKKKLILNVYKHITKKVTGIFYFFNVRFVNVISQHAILTACLFIYFLSFVLLQKFSLSPADSSVSYSLSCSGPWEDSCRLVD